MADAEKLPFHRKYRPATLVDYVGNEKMKQTAMAALAKDNKPQVILLYGASGCGKTTFARILAKEYLCENRGIGGACGQCPSCQAMDDYIHTGDTDYLEHVQEIDIADQSGKRDLDSVLERVTIPSFGGQWEVFIFDECHMATPGAQNRLLKIAEEPPEYKLMIFCTTDPQMMIETLKNRCQLQLHVKKPNVKELAGHLRKICAIESADCDIKGLNFIANRSDLTIRQALTNLEQIISEKGDAKYESAIEVFEEVSDRLIVDFYKKLLGTPDVDKYGEVRTGRDGGVLRKRDVVGYVSLLHTIRTQVELRVFLNNLIDFTKRGIYVINQVQLDGISDGEMRTYRELFGEFSIEQMAVLITKLLDMMKGGDIEAQLLLMGYRGFELSIGENASGEVVEDTLMSGVVGLANEHAIEERVEGANREQQKKDLHEQGITEAEKMVQGSNLEAVQALFGGVDVVG